MEKTYKIKNQINVSYDSQLSQFWFINDKIKEGDFTDRELKEYFTSSFEIFSQHLERFKNLDNKIDAQEEKLLKFMLDSLIYAKQSLQEAREDKH
ncbi:hypothetical protein C4572_03120 [Candidatus Parcubacteria bacterium]|nr:MAG: hypothetical protein C4572_03120 [Candidatus Parcubacteria bacterium]